MHDIDAGARALERLEVLLECGPPNLEGGAQRMCRGFHLMAAFAGAGGGRKAAHPDDFGRDALTDLGLGRWALFVEEIRMRMDIDEPRRDHERGCVDDTLGVLRELRRN